MQKKLIALAIAAAASGAAFAQTNVQIYGIADVGYLGVDTDGANFKHNINSGLLSTSRIGFKGAEDLGNGLKAIFTLEYGLQMDKDSGIGTGAGGTGARQQFVGLTGGFGTVVAGRLQTAGLDWAVAASPLGGSAPLGAASNVGVGTLLTNSARANNAVAYISPSFGGLTVAINHARAPLGSEGFEGAKGKDANASLIALNYDNAGLSAGLVYGVYNQKDAEIATVNFGRVVDVNYVPVSPTQWAYIGQTNNAGGILGVEKSKEWGLRASYDFTVAKIYGAYQQQKLDYVAVGANSDKDKKWVVGVSAPITAKIGVIGEYAQAKFDNGDKNKAFTLAATYSLSKRTTAYAGFLAIRPESNVDTNAYAAGLRHAF